jgi:hypothetical protein
MEKWLTSMWHPKRWVLAVILICAAATVAGGCRGAALGELASSNQVRLSQISLGMSKEVVIATMGHQSAETHDGVVHNPWIVEMFADKDGTAYEILYYVTRKNRPFRAVDKRLATPVILKDGKVVGWGDALLQRITDSKGR